jgi:hypothetical protein
LRSAADGFRHAGSGKLLGDGDYVQTFQVPAPEDVVVSLPDFSRGAGQPVDVPAMESGLPLRISGGTGVTSVEQTIIFNPSLLTITAAAPGPEAASGASVDFEIVKAGEVRIAYSAATALGGGAAQFVSLTAAVPGTAGSGSLHVLDLRDVRVNGGAIPVTADDALHSVSYFGDTTGNGDYSGLDAVLIARLVVGLDAGYAAYPRTDPVILGDITGNGDLSGLDAVLVAQEVVGLDPDEIPSLGGGQAPALAPAAAQAEAPLAAASVPQESKPADATRLELPADWVFADVGRARITVPPERIAASREAVASLATRPLSTVAVDQILQIAPIPIAERDGSQDPRGAPWDNVSAIDLSEDLLDDLVGKMSSDAEFRLTDS